MKFDSCVCECVQSQMKVMAAELVARAGELDRLKTDLQTVQAESQNLRSEVTQLTQRAEETQKKLESEVVISMHLPLTWVLVRVCVAHRRMPHHQEIRLRDSLGLRWSAKDFAKPNAITHNRQHFAMVLAYTQAALLLGVSVGAPGRVGAEGWGHLASCLPSTRSAYKHILVSKSFTL